MSLILLGFEPTAAYTTYLSTVVAKCCHETSTTSHEKATRVAITFVNKVLTVDRSEFELTLWRRSLIGHEFKKEKVYPVAVGKAGYTTPARVYLINSRSRSPSWLMPDADWVQPPEIRGTILPAGDPNNPIKARWLGVTDPLHGIGIHGTDDDASIGSAASHGCIRMHIPDVIELFDLVKARTPIHIHGG